MIPNESGHFLFPMDGGSPVRFDNMHGTEIRLRWSSDAKLLYLTLQTSYPWGEGRTYLVPLQNGQMFPPIPPGGFQTESEIQKLRPLRVIDSYDVAPGPAPDTYAYSREIVGRNLYRIPVPPGVH